MLESQKKSRLDSATPPRPADIDPIPEPAHQTVRAKAWNWLIVAALAVIAAVIGVFLFWSLQTQSPLVIKNSPFPTRSVRTNAEPNGVIILLVDFCKNTTKQGEVRTSFVSKTREVFLPIAKEQFDKGCAKEEVPVLIPKDLPADDYKLKFTARYDINPLKQSVPVVFESQTFHVNPLGTDEHLVQPR